MDRRNEHSSNNMNTFKTVSDQNLPENEGNQGNNEDSQVKQDIENPHNNRQLQYAGAYSVMAPDESRRSKLKTMAQKEEEDLQRYKEEHRPGPVCLPPERLGGATSMAEARQKQLNQLKLNSLKIQKKLKQEEMDRKRREAEEEENLMMKAKQREKAMKLEEKRRLEDQLRREQYKPDHQVKTQQFLHRIEQSSAAPLTSGSSTPRSSWDRGREHRETQRALEETLFDQRKEEQRRKTQLLELREKLLQEDRERELSAEQRRVNAAFLDRLQGSGGSGSRGAPSPQAVRQDLGPEAYEAQEPASSTGPEVEDKDYNWAVMKLLSLYPNYQRDVLMEIVTQCQGNYEQASSLLQ